MAKATGLIAVWIECKRVFDGQNLCTSAALQVEEGRVTRICAVNEIPDQEKRIQLDGLVSPGFIDLQVNGAGGVLLNSAPTAASMSHIAQTVRAFGTVAVMPTLISDAPEVLSQTVEAAVAAKAVRGVLGLHLEGPHIAPARRGTHASGYLRSMDNHTIDCVRELVNQGVKTLLTVAPEAASTQQIADLVNLGAVVSLGHTDATAEAMQDAFAAGASSATHLFNAMSPMTGRAPGAVGAAINSSAYVGIICDGHHVSDDMVGLAIRSRPVDNRMVLVSDAMPTVGGPDSFELYDQTITVRDGRLINNEGSLAGAHTTQIEGVKRLVECTGTSLNTALRMVTSNPAACMGVVEMGELLHRPLSDVILLDDALSYVGTLHEFLQSASS